MLLNDSYPPRRLGYTDNEHLGFTGRLDTALQLAPRLVLPLLDLNTAHRHTRRHMSRQHLHLLAPHLPTNG